MINQKKIRVAAFTGSETISSRRFRLLQYVPFLENEGIVVDEFISRYGSWPPAQKWKRPYWLVGTLADRIIPAIKSRQYNLVFLQRELVSTLYTLERFLGRPRILDVDDAVWLNGNLALRSFSSLVSSCDGVICGNKYIADQASKWNKRVIVLPTAVDTDRFAVAKSEMRSKKIIGWSGLFAGSKYLLSIEDAIYEVIRARPNTILRVVSDALPKFRKLSPESVEFIRWSPDNEVRTIQQMDVGLMPLNNDEWSRGKCSYKMLLYMSCGIPVVVPPFGMNKDVLSMGNVGIGPECTSQWIDSIVSLLDDADQRLLMGREARTLIENHFSIKKIGPKLAEFIRSTEKTNVHDLGENL